MKIAILSDIHGNLGALEAVLADLSARDESARYALLGDLVNYGPRSDEAVDRVRLLVQEQPPVANLAGNHEAALKGIGLDRFSTERGVWALQDTAGRIRSDNHAFLREKLSYEPATVCLDGRRVLFVHGSLHDPYWGKLRGPELESPDYAPWDRVFCGHTHVPLYHEQFNPGPDPALRGKRRTVFVNPGSVGQPRNHEPRAQYAMWDTQTDEVDFRKVAYDVAAEQACFADGVDAFYRERLERGV